MSSTVAKARTTAEAPSRSTRSRMLRALRMAAAFLVVAGSLGLATVTATAQTSSTSCPSRGASAYADLTDLANYAYDDSRCLKELGIPAPGNYYRPDDDMTRSEMARFMARTYAIVTGSEAPIVATPFTDVDANDPNADDIARIFGLDITTGTTPTTYSPGSPVIRGHMALFLARLYKQATGSDAPVVATDFTDISTRSAEQRDAIARIYGLEVTTGTTRTTFSPTDNVTRRQMASFVARMYRVLDATVDPAEVPGLVGNLSSTPRNMSLALSWTAPADDGGSEITGYLISWRTGRQSTRTAELDDGAATSYTITGLRNSSVYSVTVRAKNAVGNGEAATVPAGSNNALVTPTPTAPTAPRDLTVTPGNQMLTLRWKEPADDGGTTFTGYTIERRCGTANRYSQVSGSPQVHNTTSVIQTITIRNVANGDPCDVRVAANSYYDANGNNSQGSNEPTLVSPWANASGTPATLPAAPTNVTVTTAHQSLQVSWSPPTNNGGSPVTGYRLTWSAGIPAEVTIGNRTSHTITGLDNRFAYTVSVKTITAVGESAAAFASGSTQPQAVPAAPTNVTVTNAPQYLAVGQRNPNAGTSLVVTWDAPPANGTNPINGYAVQRRDSLIPASTIGGSPTPASQWINTGVGTIDTVNRTVTITGLSTGRSYDVRVQATNDHDSNTATLPLGGPWAMGSGTPATAPAAVTPILEAGYQSIIVSWDQPNDNGSPITHYLVRYAENNTGNEPYSADIRVDAPASRTRITGLQVGVPYVVQVQAVNALGTGPNLDTETQATTNLIPDAPTSVKAVPTPDGNGNTLTVTWNRVTRTNGSGPVVSYIVETRDLDSPGSAWIPTTGIDGNTTTAIVNVVKGRTYMVRVKAVAGLTGSSGYIDAPVTAASAPDAPAQLAATLASDNRTINVVWTAVPANTPSDIIGYTVSWYSTTDLVSGARGQATITSNTTGTYSIRGLPPGSYAVQVVATNHIGDSPVRTASVTIPVPT
ncbi:MAG: hypothetical protein F4Z58_12040 [Acidimicrobiaceae bacterium]|nr:hypothetical protein [Acidimicrobiaceae bacterium]MXW76743.1 hypothetical protein [Acidimicrobiaceae bacterium]MYC43605.1 hypothetical protein [Acidimicrobiaceae bacterium]MYD06506.1 hypothetical protein [Acidimicrobiaceae bacterium]MYI58815.1 hypothetical protein [Acidimicrobiaceae bacterium]